MAHPSIPSASLTPDHARPPARFTPPAPRVPSAASARSARSTLAATLVLALAAIGCGDGAGPAAAPGSERLELAARQVLEAHRTEGEFPGAVMAVHDPGLGDALVTSGTTRPEPGAAAVAADVPWAIGSVTKTFVAVVALQLAEEGGLDLDAGIDEWFPDLPRAGEITPRQLLQHTSGLGEYLDAPAVQSDAQRPWSPGEIVAVAVGRGPSSEPGGEHRYSNTNYVVLGEIVGEVGRRPWYELVHERILEPLGMQDTHYAGEPLAPPVGPGFGIEEGRFVDYTTRWHPTLGGSAGALQSTAPDLMRFARALSEGGLLAEPLQAEMRAFVPAQPYGPILHEYGLGFEKYVAGELTVYGHLGSASAHASFFGFEPDSGVVVAVLTNSEPAPPPALMALELLGALTGRDVGLAGD